MKRILFLIAGLLFLFSCEYQNNGVTSINDVITTDYLLNGDLDTYLQNSQVFRHKGKPGIETIVIGNENLSDFEDCFVMCVATGNTPETTVSSAIIKLDDMVVLNTSDFSKNTGQHTFEVCNLTPTSVLTVEIRGEPGSYIDIWIEGKLKGLTAKDGDGYIYKTVQIGSQIWLAEDLKTTKFNDGTSISNVPDYSAWRALSTPGYCWYNNDISNKVTYGALYNWYAVQTGKICPIGWHVPSNTEWTTLADYLQGWDLAGGKIKEVGLDHWLAPNTGATNESQFTGLPAGERHGVTNQLDFEYLKWNGYGWSSTEYSLANAGYVNYRYDNDNLGLGSDLKVAGFPVRCLKSVNSRPSSPSNPSPSDGATDVSTMITLTWTCSDPENDKMTFDVYIGTTDNPSSQIGVNLTESSLSTIVANGGVKYYWKVIAKDDYGNPVPGPVWSFSANQVEQKYTVTDIENNVYNIVSIGSQIWMAENLKTTKYNDNTAIPLITDNIQWASLYTPGYTWYNNDASTYKDTYGALYNWYALDPASNGGKNVCPLGWHVPTNAEWTDLIDYLGGTGSGGKLKEMGTAHWMDPNTGASNETGFTALANGYHNTDGSFGGLKETSIWWSSTESGTYSALLLGLYYSNVNVSFANYSKVFGFNARCLKD